jgi:hypothetical protein
LKRLARNQKPVKKKEDEGSQPTLDEDAGLSDDRGQTPQ